MYTLHQYSRMIGDRVRTEAYRRALEHSIVPDESVVLDIGAGTGILAMFAARAGARKVYAVDPSPCIQVAREVSAANGFGDRIEFIPRDSRDVTLERKADVIVSDLRGILPLCGTNTVVLADARRRHLAPGGLLIPERDVLWMTPAESAEVYDEIADPWKGNTCGFDWTLAREKLLNTWIADVRPIRKLAPPQACFEVDYNNLAGSNFSAEPRFRVAAEGTLHGLVLWFETRLAGGIGFSAGPDSPETIYKRGFFPLENAVRVAPGDSIEVRLSAHLVEDEYVWRWQTRVVSPSGAEMSVGDQSTYLAELIPIEALRRKRSDHVPQLTADGEAARLALSIMDGHAPIEEIAGRLQRSFPNRFPADRAAFEFVVGLAGRFY